MCPQGYRGFESLPLRRSKSRRARRVRGFFVATEPSLLERRENEKAATSEARADLLIEASPPRDRRSQSLPGLRHRRFNLWRAVFSGSLDRSLLLPLQLFLELFAGHTAPIVAPTGWAEDVHELRL